MVYNKSINSIGKLSPRPLFSPPPSSSTSSHHHHHAHVTPSTKLNRQKKQDEKKWSVTKTPSLISKQQTQQVLPHTTGKIRKKVVRKQRRTKNIPKNTKKKRSPMRFGISYKPDKTFDFGETSFFGEKRIHKRTRNISDLTTEEADDGNNDILMKTPITNDDNKNAEVTPSSFSKEKKVALSARLDRLIENHKARSASPTKQKKLCREDREHQIENDNVNDDSNSIDSSYDSNFNYHTMSNITNNDNNEDYLRRASCSFLEEVCEDDDDDDESNKKSLLSFDGNLFDMLSCSHEEGEDVLGKDVKEDYRDEKKPLFSITPSIVKQTLPSPLFIHSFDKDISSNIRHPNSDTDDGNKASVEKQRRRSLQDELEREGDDERSSTQTKQVTHNNNKLLEMTVSTDQAVDLEYSVLSMRWQLNDFKEQIKQKDSIIQSLEQTLCRIQQNKQEQDLELECERILEKQQTKSLPSRYRSEILELQTKMLNLRHDHNNLKLNLHDDIKSAQENIHKSCQDLYEYVLEEIQQSKSLNDMISSEQKEPCSSNSDTILLLSNIHQEIASLRNELSDMKKQSFSSSSQKENNSQSSTASSHSDTTKSSNVSVDDHSDNNMNRNSSPRQDILILSPVKLIPKISTESTLELSELHPHNMTNSKEISCTEKEATSSNSSWNLFTARFLEAIRGGSHHPKNTEKRERRKKKTKSGREKKVKNEYYVERKSRIQKNNTCEGYRDAQRESIITAQKMLEELSFVKQYRSPKKKINNVVMKSSSDCSRVKNSECCVDSDDQSDNNDVEFFDALSSLQD